MFSVELLDRSFSHIGPSGLTFAPKRWSGNVRGGCEFADIEVTGRPEKLLGLLLALRYGVTIRNRHGGAVWWGYVHEASVTVKSTQATVTLDRLFNRVRTQYSYESGEGLVNGITDWQDDTLSQTTYGIKELREEASDTTAAAALEIAKRSLAKHKKPVGAPTPVARSGTATATLTCRGWFDTLGWRYFEQPAGRLVHNPSATTSALLGWGYTGHIGFHAATKSIHQIDCRIAGLRKGDRVIISASNSNNGTKTVVNEPSRDVQDSYTATTISFASLDDIEDSAGGLAFIDSGELILVSGDDVSANNGYHFVKTTGAERVEISGSYNGTTGNSAAGQSVTIKQGCRITVSESVTNEIPGAAASVTITNTTVKLAQRFTPTTAGSWLVGEVGLHVKRVGAPTDSFKVSLYNDSGGNIGTLLESITYTGVNIQKSDQLLLLTATGNSTIVNGSWYWLIAERTGSNDSQHYYEVALTEDSISNSLLEYTGSAWQTRTPLASMIYEVWGVRETTRQIQDIVTASGSLLRGTTVVTHSGVKKNLYRDGTRWAMDEVIDLLDYGYADGRYLFADVSPERFLKLYPSPTFNYDQALVWQAGKLFGQSNTRLQPGVLPYGQWMLLSDFPTTTNQQLQLSPVLLDSVEYDAENDQYNWTQYGAEDRYS